MFWLQFCKWARGHIAFSQNSYQTHQDSEVEEYSLITASWCPYTLRKQHLSTAFLVNFCCCANQSILFSGITVFYGNCIAADYKILQWVVNMTQTITGSPLASVFERIKEILFMSSSQHSFYFYFFALWQALQNARVHSFLNILHHVSCNIHKSILQIVNCSILNINIIFVKPATLFYGCSEFLPQLQLQRYAVRVIQDTTITLSAFVSAVWHLVYNICYLSPTELKNYSPDQNNHFGCSRQGLPQQIELYIINLTQFIHLTHLFQLSGHGTDTTVNWVGHLCAQGESQTNVQFECTNVLAEIVAAPAG